MTEYLHERPLLGYGLEPIDPQWPGQAKIAVAFVIEYTEGAESSPEYGDARSESMFCEMVWDISRPERDDMGEAEWEYGTRAGLPRLLKLFKKYNLTGTLNVVSRALQKSPYWEEQVKATDWEVSCGGARWLDYMHVEPTIERDHLCEALEYTRSLKQNKAIGCSIEHRSNYTQTLYSQAAKDQGTSVLYSAESGADDLPYWQTNPLATPDKDEGLLIIPNSIDCSDVRFNVNGQGFSNGAAYLQYLKDTFDFLYEEGSLGQGKMMTIALHPRIIGHGSRLYYLEQFLKYIIDRSGTWITSRAEIARHWRSTFPYRPELAHDKIHVPKNINPCTPDALASLPAELGKVHLPARDFTGYGFEQPSGDVWPGGAKIAISFILNYEEGAEHTAWNGDSHSEAFLNEANYWRKVVYNKRDMFLESLYDYGTRAGLPRIIRLFKKYDKVFTVWACSRAVEATPQYAPILLDMGCEIAAHGNRWITQSELSGPEEEYLHIRQGIERLQTAAGRTDLPSGYYFGRGTKWTKYLVAKVHQDLGLPLLYCSDNYADDLPYWTESPLVLDGQEDDGQLVIPYGLVNNDHRFYDRGAGFSNGDHFFETLKGDFDMLYSEGEEGQPKMMTIALHSRIIGRAGRLHGLEKFLQYIETKSAVWIAKRSEIAEHWRKRYPYKGPQRDNKY